MRVLIAFLIIGLLTGCASVKTVQYGEVSGPAKPEDFPIEILDKSDIEHPYKVIGMVQVRQSYYVSMEKVVEKLKINARKIGGDALTELKHSVAPIGDSYHALWTAKVIVWENP